MGPHKKTGLLGFWNVNKRRGILLLQPQIGGGKSSVAKSTEYGAVILRTNIRIRIRSLKSALIIEMGT